jgi:hypothetical protein
MNNEQENLCREFLRTVLDRANVDGFGWRSDITLTFTEDERNEIQKIIGGEQ